MLPQFKNRTWFVTGATGLVGSSIISKLLEFEVNIIALARPNSSDSKKQWLRDTGVKLIEGDLFDTESYKHFLGTCDIVVHTAAAVRLNDEEATKKVNVEGTRIIVQTMKEFNISRIIHISTVGVYGTSNKVPITEKFVPNPIGVYSQSKLEAENILLEDKQLNVTIFRPPYIIGDLFWDRHVVPTLTKLLNHRILPRLWRKNPQFGFVHARDIASAIILASSNETTPSQIYNIQSFSLGYKELLEYSKLILQRNIIKIPLPFSFLKILAVIIDTITGFVNKSHQLSRRLQTIRYNWNFDTSLIEEELKWESQHQNPHYLFTLLSESLLSITDTSN
ncbi:MAG: NAD-dependent epimerase/dehydratase family protein [Candidatus Heimdallarchaeota archaeon]|nr:NAD-dependent epimerase/dehydratase family protein [Candidatus Heimdallarchaeota archaeon]